MTQEQLRGRGSEPASIAAAVRERVLTSCDAYWHLAAFEPLPASAVSRALSRLARHGELVRVRKGLYYRPRPTVVGDSQPSEMAVAARVLGSGARPTDATAANLLGLTTQNPARPSYVVMRSNAPTGLDGMNIRARRNPSTAVLGTQQGALLEVLRARASTSDLGPEQTIQRLKAGLSDQATLNLLADVAASEPPRVRAMLGALAQEAGLDGGRLAALRVSLNPLSRFDFGKLRGLRHAKEWQAK